MFDTIAEQTLDLIARYQALQTALNALQVAMAEDHMLPAWVDQCTLSVFNDLSDRDRAFAVLKQLEYFDEQAPKEILVCPGFVAASENTIICAHAVNEAKSAFKDCVLALKQAKIKLNDEKLTDFFEGNLPQRQPKTTDVLKRFGLQRLHLKQCYRRLVILPEPPTKIAWTWANTRAIKKINKTRASELLSKKGKDPGIVNQLNQLTYLHEDEPLAIIQELAPHLRANLLYEDKSRQMVKGAIPIFYPVNGSIRPPHYKAPKEKKPKDKNRLIRADLQIDPVPFLPAIHAHRYISFSSK